MAAYVEVQTSNWSKTNPNTGVIDKTPDGKWIKGVNYRPPNLTAVLAAARARDWVELAEQENPGYYPGQ